MIDDRGNTKKIEVYPPTGALFIERDISQSERDVILNDLRFMQKTFNIITLDLNLEERPEGTILRWRPHPQEETIKRWNDGGKVGSD